MISWCPPPEFQVKIKTDGASRGNPGLAGDVGVIRDACVRCLVGFSAHLGMVSNMAAELHARRFGLLLALYSGFREVLSLSFFRVLFQYPQADTARVTRFVFRSNHETEV